MEGYEEFKQGYDLGYEDGKKVERARVERLLDVRKVFFLTLVPPRQTGEKIRADEIDEIQILLLEESEL